MQQLTGRWSDLNTDNMLVGEMAVPDDHNPVVKTANNQIKEIALLEDMDDYERYISMLQTAIDEANGLIDKIKEKVGIDDTQASYITTYSSKKIEGAFDDKLGTTNISDVGADVTSAIRNLADEPKIPANVALVGEGEVEPTDEPTHLTSSDIADNLVTSNPSKVLSARMGKELNDKVEDNAESIEQINTNKVDIPIYDAIASYGGGIYSSDTSFTMGKSGIALIQVANWTDDTFEGITVKINNHSVGLMTPTTRYKRESLTLPVRNGDVINFSGMSVGTFISINLM